MVGTLGSNPSKPIPVASISGLLKNFMFSCLRDHKYIHTHTHTHTKLGTKFNLGIRVMPKVRKKTAPEFGHKRGEIQVH